jgi:arsenate reductase
MLVTLYGIPNCDSVKRARTWLAERHILASFHDFKKSGVPPARLDVWLETVGWERLLNRKGTTWRKLDDSVRAGVVDAASARAVMVAYPSVIRRPVVEWAPNTVTVGFDPALWPKQ